MTRANLQSLRKNTALPHTLNYDQLARYHVPFDELTGETTVEAELAHWLGSRGRVALIGASGSGKSSALAWALDRQVPAHVVALRIPIALAGDETVQTTQGFARHLIRRVIATARLQQGEVEELRGRAADSVRHRGEQRRRSRRLGVNAGPINADIVRELTGAGSEFDEQIGAGEVVEGLQRMIAMFRAHDREPLLVLEDSDTWIARPHDQAPAKLADAFFSRNVRMLASELDCGFVVAVHTTYLNLPAYREVAGRLERVQIPQLPDPEADLTRIIARRLELAGMDFTVGDVFEPDALTALASLYEDARDVRRAIATAASAARLALDEDQAERVTRAAIRAAAAERAGEEYEGG
jgi:hypothetical protein